jgi:hypothetical protein
MEAEPMVEVATKSEIAHIDFFGRRVAHQAKRAAQDRDDERTAEYHPAI